MTEDLAGSGRHHVGSGPVQFHQRSSAASSTIPFQVTKCWASRNVESTQRTVGPSMDCGRSQRSSGRWSRSCAVRVSRYAGDPRPWTDRCPEATRAGPGNLLPHCSGSPLDVGHLNAPSIMQARDQPAVQRAQPLRFGQPRSGLEAPRHFGNALGPGVDRRLRKVRRPVSTVFDCRHRHVTSDARAIDEVRHRGVDHVG